MGAQQRHPMKGRRDTIKIEFLSNKEQHSYTPGDEINGYAWVKTSDFLIPGYVEIALRGRSRVENDAFLQPIRTYRQHNFLEMQQLVEVDAFTSYEVVENGFLYKFPFTFTVPGQLPIHACRHQEQQLSFHNTHLNLPPTMGIVQDGTKGFQSRSLCPENLSIAYAVEIKLKEEKAGFPHSKEPWNFAARQITIIPLSEIISSSKILQGSFFNQPRPYPPPLYQKHARLDSLHIETLTENPVSIYLPVNPIENSIKDITTIIPLRVCYSRKHRGPMPRLNKISRNLIAHTTLSDIQDRALKHGKPRPKNHHLCTSRLTLPSLNMSAQSKHTMEEPRGSHSEAIIQVPVSLSPDLKLEPSFESCLIARSYTLEICVFWRLAGKMNCYSTVLEIPLEIKVTR